MAVGAGESRIELGMEQFDWNEYGQGGEHLLRESGTRLSIGLEHHFGSGKRGLFSLLVRGYFGDVDYEGYLQYPDGQSAPYSTRTHYWGGVIEPRYIYRIAVPGTRLQSPLTLAIGGEWWLRDLRGKFGYREYYRIGYFRLEAGLERRQPSGWFIRAGVKSPFLVEERISGFYLDGACSDVELSPGENDTVSVTIGYRFRGHAAISIGYDAYLLSASPSKEVNCENGTGLQIHQPKSKMQSLSLRYSILLPEM